MAEHYVHPTALVESDDVGAGTRIWAHAHVMAGASIGPDCNICDGSFIESGVTIGRGVTVKLGVMIHEGVTIEDGVFVGPHVVFTNDLRPRSPRLLAAKDRYAGRKWLSLTRVEVGATLGANATIGCGLTIGAWSFVAAGAVVVRDVAPFTLVMGNPARPTGHVCVCNEPLALEEGKVRCPACSRSYRSSGRTIEPVEPIELWLEDPSAA